MTATDEPRVEIRDGGETVHVLSVPADPQLIEAALAAELEIVFVGPAGGGGK